MIKYQIRQGFERYKVYTKPKYLLLKIFAAILVTVLISMVYLIVKFELLGEF